MRIPILDLTAQYEGIKEEIQGAIAKVLASGQFVLGEEVRKFEQEAAAYLRVKHAIGVNSGTDALMIGLRALGIQPGDEVITTPFSFFATAEAISNIGAKPIFTDIHPISFNIDPEGIKNKITPATKAIMPVHLYGQPAPMTQIMEIAQAHGLFVIEDCAQSFGARYYGDCEDCKQSCNDKVRSTLHGKFTGTIGQLGAYSFFPTKNLGAYGDGGLVVTNDDKVAELARILRVHGSKQRYENEILGYNSRLDALQAAILRVKLKYLPQWNEQRRKVAYTYNELMWNLPHVTVPSITDGHVFHQYTIAITNGKRDEIATYMATQGIASMIYYPVPIDQLPVYKGQYPKYPVSHSLAHQVLSLPIWPELDNASIEIIVSTLIKAL